MTPPILHGYCDQKGGWRKGDKDIPDHGHMSILELSVECWWLRGGSELFILQGGVGRVFVCDPCVILLGRHLQTPKWRGRELTERWTWAKINI